MKAPILDIRQSIHEVFSEWRSGRRAFLRKAGAGSLGLALAALGTPRPARGFPSSLPPPSYTTLLGICTGGTGTVTYTPGIKNDPQMIHLDGTVTFSLACAVVQNKAVVALTYDLDAFMSCSGISDVSGTGVIHYTAGQPSDWTLDSWTATRQLGQCVALGGGLITHGPFSNARVWLFSIRTISDPATCASASGVIGATGTDVLIVAN